MDLRLNITDLTNQNDLLQLKNIISELADALDILYTETAPNGNISARQGRIALYKNGSAYEQWQNIDGDKTWQRTDGILETASADYFSSSTIVGWAAGKTGYINYVKTGKIVFIDYHITGTSDNALTTFTLPFVSAASPANTIIIGTIQDSGGALTVARHVLAANASLVSLNKNMAGDSFTASGTKLAQGQFYYKCA